MAKSERKAKYNAIDTKWNRIASSPEAAALLKLYLRIDQICDHEGSVSEFLPNLLHQIAQLLDVQTICVTAYNPEKVQNVLSRYDRGEAKLSDDQLEAIALKSTKSKEWIRKNDPDQGVENLLAIPIIKSSKVLGSLILVNKSSGDFAEYDNIVVTLIETRLDDVIDDMLRQQEQRRISTENRVIKELDMIRDESRDQGQALDQMIATISESVESQIGFITLYDSEKDRHLPGGKVLRGTRPMSQDDYHEVGNLVRTSKERHTTILLNEPVTKEIDSILVVPMFMGGRFLGSVVLVNKEHESAFTSQDKDLVESVAKIIGSFIYQEEKFKRLAVLVGREATQDVEEALIGPRPDTAHGQRLQVTMLFADIRDYSKTTKDMDPTTIVRMINDYFNAMTPIVSAHHGVVDKYVGDEIVALFTKDQPEANHQALSVEAALNMQDEMERLNREWELTGRPTIQIGIGIHSGEVVLGQIGSFDRKDYTAIGSNMNFAARLQTIAGPGQIVISEATYVGITGKITARREGPFDIKGFGSVMAYLVEGRSPDQF